MQETELEYFKTFLDSQLQELQNRIAYADIRKVSNDDGFHDHLDIASSDTDKNMLFKIREREGRLIPKIKKALQRIADGSYGICEECGEDIPTNRLRARPVATQCIECKTKEETLERIPSYYHMPSAGIKQAIKYSARD